MTTQYEVEHPKKAFGWAARDTSGVLSPFNFSRRLSFYTSFLFFICCTILCPHFTITLEEWCMSAPFFYY
jgi:cinnamyl-alcohol dehydrogenase